MSSKVRQAEETSGVEPLIWRQMHASGPARTGVDTEEKPDSRAHLAQLVLSGSSSTLYVDNVYFHK